MHTNVMLAKASIQFIFETQLTKLDTGFRQYDTLDHFIIWR